MSRYLLFASELYAVPILLPLAAAARARGHAVTWLTSPALARHLPANEAVITTWAGCQSLHADATFSTVHWLPPQLPGRKIQLFHGLNIDKRDPRKGHFRIRGLFDLYCTHGPVTTKVFEELARKHGHFAVCETGWPKLDPLFRNAVPDPAIVQRAAGRPIVMVASTFTRSLTAAPLILDTLRGLIARGDRYWLLTLHPKSDPVLLEAYQQLAGEHAQFMHADALLDMLRSADVMVCDTSSAIGEFALLGKPIVTVRTRVPKPYLIDISDPQQLDAAIARAMQREPELMRALDAYGQRIHPARDGHAAARVIAASEALLAGKWPSLRRKPLNLWRRWRARSKLRAMLRP
ncbi:MAG: CDP-glycerol glycerophosphotransferase family protein [Xanthomonadales bacterium]|nr:CDP-glycerol glycerophosphotransferase family protein [Xanthomonadales bacterium]